MSYIILANSVNTNCRPFQVKINCSKLIIDRLQQRCDVTFLIYLFVTSRNLFVWCISAKENYYNITKNSRKFQASATETCTSQFPQNLLKVPVKKLNL